jgi:hypothetical protein
MNRKYFQKVIIVITLRHYTKQKLNFCENETLNDSTIWDNVMCKNVTLSYNFAQPTDFKITISNTILHHIC